MSVSFSLSVVIDVPRGGGPGGGGGRGRENIVRPPTNFKTIVNENPIKPEIGGPPQAIFPESLDPPRDFGKKHQVPPPLECASVAVVEFFYVI